MSRVIDAHQHFWNLETGEYPWLSADYGPLYRTFAPDELAPQLQATGVDGTVLVQAADSVADTAAMLAQAEAHDWITGVVGWVPLDRPEEAATVLDRHAGHPAFVGVRHLIHEEADPDWVVGDRVLDGLALLAEHDLTFDVVAVLDRHLEHVPTLAERLPGLRLVIDHLAKPPIKEQGWEPWASLLRRAAEAPNVSAKISGLNTAADWESWSAEELRPYVEHALEVFGPQRLMWGSDWPIALLAGDYESVWRETNALIAPLHVGERDDVLGGTATRVYRLDGPAT